MLPGESTQKCYAYSFFQVFHSKFSDRTCYFQFDKCFQFVGQTAIFKVNSELL